MREQVAVFRNLCDAAGQPSGTEATATVVSGGQCMWNHPGTMSIRRILLVSLLPGAVVVALQSAWLAARLLLGDRGADPLAALTVGLLFGVLAWLGTAAVLLMKSRHRA